MAHDGDLVEVVHSGAAEMPVRNGKSGRLDDVGLDAETNVSPDYKQGNNAFTGRIGKVTVSVE